MVRRAGGRVVVGAFLGYALISAGCTAARGQVLARPGWAGSGLTVTQWWRSAVIFAVDPENAGQAGALLLRLTGELDDLQVLGVDAMLLRGVDAAGTPTSPEQGRVSAAYGSLEQFDALLEEASRRRVRVIVEVPATLKEEDLAAAARFWLSRGVGGLFLGQVSEPPMSPGGTGAGQGSSTDLAAGVANSGAAAAGYAGAKGALLRKLLHSYVGDRILVGEAATQTQAVAGGPEMLLKTIRGFGPGQVVDVAAVRTSVADARAGAVGRSGPVSVVQLDPAGAAVSGDGAKARLAVLAMMPGGIALREGESGAGPGAEAASAKEAQAARDQAALAQATSPAAVGNVKRAIARREAGEPPRYAGDGVFAWAERMIGLHRGSAAMLRGQQTLLNLDDKGAVVSVWREQAGPVLCEIVNLRDTSTELSLTAGFADMRLRGSFLKPVARTDAGMGAVPLSRVKLPPYGVFVGELGR